MELAASPGQLLSLLRARPEGFSRASLLAHTGMARSTLYERLDSLFAAGLAYEAEPLASTGGRPARRIRFDDRDKVVVAFDIGQTQAGVHLLTLRHRILDSIRFPFDSTRPVEEAVGPLLDAALKITGGREPVGAGIGLSAPVDATGVKGYWRAVLGHWDMAWLAEAFEGTLGCPIVLENDARAMAVGEADHSSESLVAVKVSTGIGCGIIVDGALVRGVHGVAGDIGHVRIPEAAHRVCRCGRTGCLAAIASGRALLDDPRLPPCRTAADIAAAYDAGHSGTREAVAEAGRLTGSVLAAVVATLNPSRLAMGGTIGSLPSFVEGVRETVVDWVLEDVLTGLAVEPLRHPDAIAVGLSRLVERTLYDPGRVDSLMAGRGRTPAT
ncbi:ROK family protein [Sinomonas halotolerans]|uniref:ROK family protein n=1 Tax=Sinomonas halotolerans TaxID=1644133 RepID=A0ABU9WZ93_9MICC